MEGEIACAQLIDHLHTSSSQGYKNYLRVNVK